jgi:hypothetical protein
VKLIDGRPYCNMSAISEDHYGRGRSWQKGGCLVTVNRICARMHRFCTIELEFTLEDFLRLG